MTEIIVNIIIAKPPTEVERFQARVKSGEHAKLIKANQLLQKKKIIDYFRDLKQGGFIKSIFRPKNKIMQKQLDEFIKAKLTIKKTIRQLNQIFQ